MFGDTFGIRWGNFECILNNFDPHSYQHSWEYHESAGSERIIQVPGCDDCTGLSHDQSFVSGSVVAVARLGADVSNVMIHTMGRIYTTTDG